MSEAMAQMPRYRSHKVVWALVLQRLDFINGEIHPRDKTFLPIVKGVEWMHNRIKERADTSDPGVYIVYEDGYSSWSPTQSFLGGYHELERAPEQALLETAPVPVVTLRDMAQKFIGMKEVPGATANPMILAMLQLDAKWPEDDAVPWCSAFVNYIAFLCGLERTRSLRARYWLRAGVPVDRVEALERIKAGNAGNIVVILKRGGANEPGPEVLDHRGHVAIPFDVVDDDKLLCVGGNQSDSVSVAHYPIDRVLGFSELVPEQPRTPLGPRR